MIMDKRWIKQGRADGAPINQAVKDISRRALKNAPSRQTHLFASSAEKRRALRDATWDRLNSFPIDEAHLDRRRIVTGSGPETCATDLDSLRDTLLARLREKGWKRIAVTAPVARSGKTYTAVNLILSLSRRERGRAVLLDLDLHHPSVAEVLGIPASAPMSAFLSGQTPAHGQFRRAGQNLLRIGDTIAVAAGTGPEIGATALLKTRQAGAALARMERELAPDVVLYDLPPVLTQDDVRLARPHFDAVLLVIREGRTGRGELDAVSRTLGAETPVLGLVLNKAGDMRAPTLLT